MLAIRATSSHRKYMGIVEEQSYLSKDYNGFAFFVGLDSAQTFINSAELLTWRESLKYRTHQNNGGNHCDRYEIVEVKPRGLTVDKVL